MSESVTFQAILKRGREEGREEGKLQEAKSMLLQLGRKHFGTPDPRIIAVIEQIMDLTQIHQFIDRLQDVTSWEALFKLADRQNDVE
jgi:hypothetical protein